MTLVFFSYRLKKKQNKSNKTSKYFIQKKKNHFIALLQPLVFTVVSYASEVILTTHKERHWYGYFYLLQQFSL